MEGVVFNLEDVTTFLSGWDFRLVISIQYLLNYKI